MILYRFMLNLRGLYFEDQDYYDPTGTGSVSFLALPSIRVTSASVVGNLGATVAVGPRTAYRTSAQFEWAHRREEAEYSCDPFREGMLGSA